MCSSDLPIDMQFYEGDSHVKGYRRRFDAKDEYYRTISDGWSDSLKQAFDALPAFER